MRARPVDYWVQVSHYRCVVLDFVTKVTKLLNLSDQLFSSNFKLPLLCWLTNYPLLLLSNTSKTFGSVLYEFCKGMSSLAPNIRSKGSKSNLNVYTLNYRSEL